MDQVRCRDPPPGTSDELNVRLGWYGRQCYLNVGSVSEVRVGLLETSPDFVAALTNDITATDECKRFQYRAELHGSRVRHASTAELCRLSERAL